MRVLFESWTCIWLESSVLLTVVNNTHFRSDFGDEKIDRGRRHISIVSFLYKYGGLQGVKRYYLHVEATFFNHIRESERV